ncbi:MAG: ABC transporter permease [Anaerolineaceae bacterium]|jgi:ABC-2 type transport system permease protein|nr:ABC transporter permease [Anaerolineaceae bacterium]
MGKSFRRLMTIVNKEWLHVIRDVRALGLVIILPVMLLILLGFAASNDIENIPMAIADQSKSDQSRQMIDLYVASGYFQVVAEAYNEEEILRLLDQGTAQVGLMIPEDFSREMATGGSSPIIFYIDSSDPTLAQTAQLAADYISQANSQEILVQRLQRSGLPLDLQLPLDVHIRFLYNPNMRRMDFLLPGLVGVILQVQALLLTAFAIVREREQGTLEQLIVTPIKPWELILGKILPYVAVAAINLIMVLVSGMLVFGMKIAGDIALMAVLSGIFLIGSLGLGVFISTISRTQIESLYLAVFIVLPAVMLSGLIWPRQNMPWLAYYSGYLLPLTYFLEIIRGIFLKGVGAVYLWQWIWPMALFSIVVFFASVLMFRKRL